MSSRETGSRSNIRIVEAEIGSDQGISIGRGPRAKGINKRMLRVRKQKKNEQSHPDRRNKINRDPSPPLLKHSAHSSNTGST